MLRRALGLKSAAFRRLSSRQEALDEEDVSSSAAHPLRLALELACLHLRKWIDGAVDKGGRTPTYPPTSPAPAVLRGRLTSIALFGHGRRGRVDRVGHADSAHSRAGQWLIRRYGRRDWQLRVYRQRGHRMTYRLHWCWAEAEPSSSWRGTPRRTTAAQSRG